MVLLLIIINFLDLHLIIERVNFITDGFEMTQIAGTHRAFAALLVFKQSLSLDTRCIHRLSHRGSSQLH